MNRVTRCITSVLALLTFMAAVKPPASAQEVAGPHWVATWGAAPQAGNWQDEFQNQTVRMIVHTSLGGSGIRVQISNAFGHRSLKIGAAHVALSAGGAKIISGSDHPLTFSGLSSVVIPPGALEVSDPVELHVPALSNLVVSIYVPGHTEPATKHFLGLHTTYISGSGNFTASETFPAKWTSSSYFWLAGVDVEASRQSHAIVAFGDSITDGFHSSLDKNMQWPSQFSARLQANAATSHLAVVNEGIGGNRVLHDAKLYGINALARFDRDVLAQDGVRYLTVLESINDLGFPHAVGGHGDQEVTAQQLIAGLKQIILRAHAHGILVLGCTLTPYQGADYYSVEGEAKREAINHWIRTSGAFDGVIDFDKAVRDPRHPERMLAAYDSGDHLHPNDAGYQAMAKSIDLSMFEGH
jgi:lysophospholipase L1-like esterase